MAKTYPPQPIMKTTTLISDLGDWARFNRGLVPANRQEFLRGQILEKASGSDVISDILNGQTGMPLVYMTHGGIKNIGREAEIYPLNHSILEVLL